MSNRDNCRLCGVTLTETSVGTPGSEDKRRVCIECNDVESFMVDVDTRTITAEPLAPAEPLVPAEPLATKPKQLVIGCPKCKRDLTEATCLCGFKHPLFRR